MKNILLKILLTGSLSMVFAAGCMDQSMPVETEPVAIDSSSAAPGKVVFVRNGNRFESDNFFKDEGGIYHGGYAFYQISTQELSIYGRRGRDTAAEVIHLTTRVPVQKQAPFVVADYTIEYQDGIILKGNAYQTDAQHFGTFRISKFDLGAGLVSGTFESVLKQTFPINKNDSTRIRYGSFTDVRLIIMD